MPQTPMTVRIDSQQKAMFDSLCEQFGMSANTAINIFVRQVIRLRRIPFIISATETDEDLRAKAIEAFQSLRKEAETSMEPEMTLEEINAEINSVRKARRHPHLKSSLLSKNDNPQYEETTPRNASPLCPTV